MSFKFMNKLLLLLAINLPCLAAEKSRHLDDYILRYVAQNEFNGTVLVAKQGETLLEKGYGFADMEWEIPNAPDTKFRIASTTKPFTALLVLILVEKGDIDLSQTINHYLPNYRQDVGNIVTIRQLLNHTSGIPDVFSFPKFKDIETNNPYGLDEFIVEFCSGDLNFAPGTQFRYSNAGYIILGKIIEQVTGLTYQQALQKYILMPLNMHDTGLDSPKKLISKRAQGYDKNLEGYEKAAYLDISIPFSSGSIYSTASDLFKLHNALYKNQLISKKLKLQAYTPPANSNYGFGWLVTEIPEQKYGKKLTELHHPGMMQGFNADFIQITEDNIFIVMLNNTGGAPLRAMTEGILDILYNKPVPLVEPRIYNQLYAEIKQHGVKAGLDKYSQLDKQGKGLNERRLNYFGYELLKVGKADAAVAFFKLNSDKYPESSNAYDSLGEAYLVNKQLELARQSYQKSLALDNKNENAVKMLGKINALETL